MQYEMIKRELHVDAAPEIVYEVVSTPEHIAQWWSDHAEFEPVAGSTGEIVWGDRGAADADVYAFTVVEATPPRLFSFRWCYPGGEVAHESNSLLVTLEMIPADGGTTLRLTETGFLAQGRTAAEVAEQYQSHVDGWSIFVPRLEAHIAKQVDSR
ncbi:MAG TPA: SRPBCC domain-containing protein [Jatrophihabitans sp.]|jgi:uncharacterized protein YndB with AHSA1/START domain|nr:SRPBCC domain-containing protein [Jatrophihabitans sp.]